MRLYDRCKQLINKLKAKKEITNKGQNDKNASFEQDSYEQAIEMYNQALRIFEKRGDENGIATTLRKLGEIEFTYENYDNAKDFYIRSRKIFLKIKDIEQASEILMNLGYIEFEKGNFEESEKLCQQSVIELGKSKNIPVIFHNNKKKS